MMDRFYGGPLNGTDSTTMREHKDGQQISHPATGAMYERVSALDTEGTRGWSYLDMGRRLDLGYGLNPDGDMTVRVSPSLPNTRLTLDELVAFVDSCHQARVPGDTVVTARVDFHQRLRFIEGNPLNLTQPRK